MAGYVDALKYMIQNEAKSIEAVSLLEKWLKKSNTGEQADLYTLRREVLELHELREDREDAEPKKKPAVPEVLDDVPVQLRKIGEGEEASASGSAQGGVMAEKVKQLEELRQAAEARRKGLLSQGGGDDSSSASYESSYESEEKKDAAAEKEEEKTAAEKDKEEEPQELEVEAKEKDAAAKEEEEKHAAEKGKDEEPKVFDPDTEDLWSLMCAYDEGLGVDFSQLTDGTLQKRVEEFMSLVRLPPGQWQHGEGIRLEELLGDLSASLEATRASQREEIRKIQEKLDEEKENLAKAESIVEEIQ